jgi:hypothetical protein
MGAEKPKWNTASLWGILLVFLVLGTVGSATFVYGILGILTGNLVYAVAIGAGGLVAALSFLFLAGILYRVDRYRGANLRKVELFE